MRLKFLAHANNGCLWWGPNSRLSGIYRLRVRCATHCATPWLCCVVVWLQYCFFIYNHILWPIILILTVRNFINKIFNMSASRAWIRMVLRASSNKPIYHYSYLFLSNFTFSNNHMYLQLSNLFNMHVTNIALNKLRMVKCNLQAISVTV